MSDPVILKTVAFGGFQKTAVLRYIDQLNADSEKMKAELDAQIAKLSAQVTDLSGQIPTEEQKAANLEKESAQEKKIRDLTELVEEQSAQMSQQKKMTAQKEEEMRAMSDKMRKLQFQAESNTYKAQKYDELSMKFGALLVDAKQEAQRIVDQATEDAKAITQEKQQRLQQMNAQFVQFKENVEQLRGELRETLEGLDKKLGKIESFAAAQTKEVPGGSEPAREERKTFAPFHLDNLFR